MAKNDIGGFFLSLGLNPDKNSFETGNKLIDGITDSFNKLIGTARNAAVVLTGTAVAAGVVESASYKTSAKLGISTEALDLWKASAKIAGVSADGLVGSMGRLADVLNHMTIDGSGIEAYSEQLWKLGLGVEDIMDLSPEKAYEKIIATAQAKAEEAQKKITAATNRLAENPQDAGAQAELREAQREKQNVTVAVGDVLGDEGQNFFIELQRQGKSIEEFLYGAGKTVFTDAESNQKAAEFAVQANTLKAEIESITKLVGSEVGGVLTPHLESVNNWLQNNGDVIKDKIKEVATTTEKIIGTAIGRISSFWDKNGDTIKTAVTTISSTTEKIVGEALKTLGDWWSAHGDELLGAIQNIGNGVALVVTKLVEFAGSETGKTAGSAWFKSAKGAVETTKNLVVDIWNGNWEKAYYDYLEGFEKTIIEPSKDLWNAVSGKGRSESSVKDGIIRPDGTVTQVAPDDWVLAARDLGDLARAFIPQNTVNNTNTTTGEYTINQTFNINGSNDMPQVLRQQAYRGAQEGLMAAFEQSSNRLQMMSGTR